MSRPKTLRYKSPSVLFAEVMNLVETGKAELFEGMFVSYDSEICQIVLLGRLPLYEYRLLSVETIDDLNASFDTLGKEGWEPYSNTVLYGGNYLQWMSRLKRESSWHRVENSSAVLHQPLTMVEGVQAMQLVARDELFSSWRNPLTVNQS